MSEKLKVLEPIDRKTLDYSFRDLEKMYTQGLLDFQLDIQRGLKWNDTKRNNYKSLLIFSILVNEPIGILKCNYADGIYHFTDGIQRSSTTISFIKGDFPLKYLPMYRDPFTKEEINLNGLHFNELPADLQEKITSYKPIIYVTDNATKAQQAYSFKATNNSMALTNTEKARAEIKDQDVIVKLAKHDLFYIALSYKQINNGDDETIIKHMWVVLNYGCIGLVDKIVTPLIIDADITESQQQEITSILDKLVACHTIVKKKIEYDAANKPKKAGRKSGKNPTAEAKRFLKKMHVASISPAVKKSIEDNVSVETLSAWILKFFYTTNSTISEPYNKSSIGGSGSPAAIKTRVDEAMKSYVEFIENAQASEYTPSDSTQDGMQTDDTGTTKDQEVQLHM